MAEDTERILAGLARLESRFDRLDARIDSLHGRVDQVNTRLDTVIDPLADLRSEYLTHGHADE